MATQMTPEEIQEIFDRYNDELLRTGKVTRETAEAFADAKAGVRNYTYQLNQSLKQLGTSTLAMAGALKDGQQGASVYNQSINSAADAIDAFAAKFGILGKIIGGIITAGARYVVEVNKQGDKLFETYQTISRFGAANAQGMSGIFRNMQDFGYNIEQLGDFGNLIRDNAQSLAKMNGTVNQGIESFASVAEGIQRTGIQTEFMRMGLTVDSINQGLGGYLRITTLTGTAQRKSTSELIQGSAEYVKNLDVLTKLTGLQSESIQQEREARMQEQRFIAVQMELEDKAAQARAAGNVEAALGFERQMEQNQKLLDMAPKELRAGLIGAMTGFVGTSKEAEALFRTMPELFQRVASQSFNAAETLDLGTKAAGDAMRNFSGLAKVGGFEEVFSSMYGLSQLRVKALKQTYAEQDRIAAQQQTDQQVNLDRATQAQVGLRQEQMEVTRAFQTMINKGINPVTKGMSNLGGAIESVVSKIPGTGEETGTTGTGRGNEPVGGPVPPTPPRSRIETPGAPQGAMGSSATMSGMTTTITNQAGRVIEQRQGGNRNWRNNNPGNIEYGQFAISMGAIGTDGRFAIFPTMDMGYKAADTLMKGKNYQNLTIAQAIRRWAPETENDVQIYQRRFQQAGFDLNKRYSDLTPEEQRRYLETKMNMEGGRAGTVVAGNVPKSAAPTLATVPATPMNREVATATPSNLSGPRDRYSTSLGGVDTGSVRTAGPTTESASSAAQSRETTELYKLQMAKMDELIDLMKTNNNINSKILQRARG